MTTKFQGLDSSFKHFKDGVCDIGGGKSSAINVEDAGFLVEDDALVDWESFEADAAIETDGLFEEEASVGRFEDDAPLLVAMAADEELILLWSSMFVSTGFRRFCEFSEMSLIRLLTVSKTSSSVASLSQIDVYSR